MAKPRMDLSAFVGKLLEEQDGDVLREGIRVLSQALMEAEVAASIGAERHERTGERTAYRNGARTRTWDTRVGTIELAIPKVTPGSYFPSLLQPRRRAEHALLAVVQEAYVHGVSTRKVDELMKALGLDGVSKSEVSRICAELDPLVEAFRTRPLVGEHPYVWVDATYHKVRVDGHVTSQATVVAVGVTTEGERQILGIDVGPSEDRAFWTAFLRSLVKRGLKGVRLVISDAHVGLKQALSTVLSGATWQRCRVHFMRNLLATVPQGAREPIAAIVRTIFAQPDHASAMAQLHKVADGLRARFPKAAALLGMIATRRQQLALRARPAGVGGVLDPQVDALPARVERDAANGPGRLKTEDRFEEFCVLHPAVLCHRSARRKAGEQAAHPPSGPRSRPDPPTPFPEGPVFQEAVGGGLSVHGLVSVHAVGVHELMKDGRHDFHHLTGHYRPFCSLLRSFASAISCQASLHEFLRDASGHSDHEVAQTAGYCAMIRHAKATIAPRRSRPWRFWLDRLRPRHSG